MNPLKFLIPLFLCISPTAWAADWDTVPTVDLTNLEEIKDTLPLLLEPRLSYSISNARTKNYSGRTVLIHDLDGDGLDELVRGGESYLTKAWISPEGPILVQDQCSFPWKYTEDMTVSFTLNGPFDLDGDGDLELMAWGATADFKEWGFWVVDAQEFEIESHFTLPAPPERQLDDRWDGTMAVIGTLPGLLEDADHLAVVVSVTVGFDAYGRGIMAIDPFTGKILWHFECGPKVFPWNVFILDLDDNGRDEVVFMGTAPDNLDHDLIGDYSDDHSRLFVLDSRGREIWSRQLETGMSSGSLQVGNFDPDPGPEVATLTYRVGFQEANLSIWSPDGETQSTLALDEAPYPLGVISDQPGGPQSFLIASLSGTLTKIRFDGSQLIPINRALFSTGLSLSLVFDYPPLDQPCIVVSDRDRSVSLLDQDLNLLATTRTDNSHFAGHFLPLVIESKYFLFSYGQGPSGFAIVENPNALPANPVLRRLATTPPLAWALICLAALTLLSWWLLVRKHRREIEARAIIPGDGDHLREARLHLLEDLELSGHGAIAPLRSLRRLIWLLDALKTGIEFNEDLNLRFREIWTDCHQDDLPRLLVILDRARATNLSHPSITTATDALQKIQIQLAEFKETDFAAGRLLASGDELHQHSETAEAALQGLRREVAELFTTDLESVVKRVLRANEENIKAAGVRLQTGQMAEGADGQGTDGVQEQLHCRIDPAELGFILDNLVGNAVQAMSGARDRQLRLTWLGTNGMVKLEVSDTGVGIANEDLDSIMETPFTTKERGGLGLPKSRRILRKYGGQLSIKSSSPGRGTTFQLLLPRARH